MEDEKKPVTLHNRPGYEERIRNTAELLASFVKENFDKQTAEEILGDLSDIVKEDDNANGESDE